MNLVAHIEQGEQRLGRFWKATALRGALGIAFAIVVLVWPNIGLATLIALFGAFALVSGGASIIAAFSTPMAARDRASLALGGLAGIVVAALVFIWPGLSALALLYVIAAWAVASGVLELWLAFALKVSGERRLLLGVSGLVSIAFGAVMFVHPGAGAVALLALVAAFAFVTGVLQIAYASELRKNTSELKQRLRHVLPPRATSQQSTVRGT